MIVHSKKLNLIDDIIKIKQLYATKSKKHETDLLLIQEYYAKQILN